MAPPKRGRFAGSSSTRRSSSEEESCVGIGGEKFSSPEAQLEFTRLLSKAVAKERGFLPQPTDGHLFNMITKRGWESFCEAPEPVPLSIVREFYAMLKPTRTTRADLDLEYILGEMCVPGTTWKYRAGTTEPITFSASAMNRYARAWNLFLCANIFPSSRSHEVTVEMAIVLWGILNEEYIDLGELLHRSIVKFLKGGTTGAIPHGSIVTKLCAAVGVRWSEEEQVQLPSAPIDHSAISRMEDWDGGALGYYGLGYTDLDAEGAAVPPRDPAARRERASRIQREVDRSGLGDVQYRRLTRRIDAMHDSHSRFAQDLTQALSTAFRATGVDID
ncbi:hypothetical protein POM88_010431 [Heracleum sosnowskyi]|uniref:Putative plant transposon protein domain-containing protein n=1 Tax=Heracleum sosnowskyi TaxID=360622 RepID=A0AAD8IWG8_9APIA|nr:hypothetical protein POM88_010431 [Heracleum sosnowskyi]